MSLLYDLFSVQPVGSIKFHGGGEYGKRLFSGIIAALGGSRKISVCYNASAFLDDWVLELIRDNQCEVLDVTSYDGILSLVNSGAYDLFYSPLPYYIRKSGLVMGTRIVGTMHGLRAIEMPTDEFEPMLTNGGLEKAKAFVKQMVPRSRLVSRGVASYMDCATALNKIITDSEHSKASIRHWLNPSADVEVRYPVPTTGKILGKADEEIIRALPERYILMVSCDRWLKNPVRGVQALDDLFSRGLLPGYRAICVGATNGDLLAGVENPDKFLRLPYVSGATLQELYARCDIFFYPTLNEGFGYPPVEAMQYGKTCVVSCTCSVPEICGDAALYFNPYDVNEMGTRLIQAADSHIDENQVRERFEYVHGRQERDFDAVVSELLAF